MLPAAQPPRRLPVPIWSTTGLFGRAGVVSAALVAGVATLATALVIYVAWQSWPLVLGAGNDTSQVIPPESLQAPAQTTTPDSGIEVVGAPSLPTIGGGAEPASRDAGGARSGIKSDGRNPQGAVQGATTAPQRVPQTAGDTPSISYSGAPLERTAIEAVPAKPHFSGKGKAVGHSGAAPPGQVRKGGGGRAKGGSRGRSSVKQTSHGPVAQSIPPGQLKKFSK